MKTCTPIRAALLGVLVLAAASSHPARADAGTGGSHRVAGILDAQRELRDEMSHSKGTYARLSSYAKAKIRERQDRVAELLEGASSLSDLRPDRQVEVVNALEDINTLITENRADHQTCWRERRTGTTMMSTVCATQAERDRLAEDARAFKSDPGVCIPTGTAGAASCGRIGE